MLCTNLRVVTLDRYESKLNSPNKFQCRASNTKLHRNQSSRCHVRTNSHDFFSMRPFYWTCC